LCYICGECVRKTGQFGRIVGRPTDPKEIIGFAVID
jgi:hypothetical protein